MPQRSLTSRFPQGSKPRATISISAPVELVSTTNMLSYNAPDIRHAQNNRPTRQPSAASSTTTTTSSSSQPSVFTQGSGPKRAASTTSAASTSADDQDRYPFSEATTPVTATDGSSVGSMSPTEPGKNHLSCYFPSAPVKAPERAPGVPARSTSHTKKTHEFLARKKSTNTGRSLLAAQHMFFPMSSSQALNAMPSVDENRLTIFALPTPPEPAKAATVAPVAQPFEQPLVAQQAPPAPRQRSQSRSRSSSNPPLQAHEIQQEQQHPFGQELAQVSEIAEEFGINAEKMTALEREEHDLRARGFVKYRAEDYISEIQGLFSMAFGDAKVGKSAIWI